MKILEDKVVEIEKVEREIEVFPRENPRKFKKVQATKYKISVCSTGTEDYKYYKEIMNKTLKEESTNPDNFNNEDILYASAFTYRLINEDWEYTGICTDMWMGIQIESTESNDIMVIECDAMEHGLLAAYLIAKELNKN